MNQSDTPTTHAHIAFGSLTREAVDAFYSQAVASGGRSHIPPQLHTEYHAGYYAAYIFDPDGNNIEAVYQGDKA